MLLLRLMINFRDRQPVLALENVLAVEPPRGQAVELGVEHHHGIDGSVAEEPLPGASPCAWAPAWRRRTV